MIQADERTKGTSGPETPLARALNCEGAVQNQVIGKISWTVIVRMTIDLVKEDSTPGPEGSGSAALKALRTLE